jgi:hypothetical protein
VVIGLVAGLTYLAAAGIGAGPTDTDHRFTLADPSWSQLMRPALDVPIGVPPSISTVAARGALAIAKGRRTATRDLAAVASALGIVLFGIAVIEAGVPAFPALLTLIAMAVSSTFWLRGVTWTNDALAPGLAMLAAWAGWRWLHTRRRAWLITAVMGGALAITEDSAWVALLPGVAALCATHLASRRERVRAGLVVTALAVCGAWPFIMRAIVAGQFDGPIAGGDVPGILALWRHSMLGGESSPALIPALRAAVPAEFTLVGAAMAALGIAVLIHERTTRYPVVATLAALLAWFWIAPRASFEHVSTPLAVSGWAAVALGLSAFYRTAVGRMGPVVVLVASLAIAAPLATVLAGAMRSSAPGSESDIAYRQAYDIRLRDLAEGTVLVAESRRVDATLLLAARQSRNRQLTIVPQTVEQVAAATAAGQRVAAMAGATANLARAGFVFDRGWIGNMPLNWIGGQTRCVALKQGEPVDVSFQLAAASFSLHGATATAQAGAAMIRMTGTSGIPVATTEPRRLRYEIASALDAAEVSLRIPQTRSPATVVVNLTSVPRSAVASAESSTPVTLCPGPQRADLMLGAADTAHALIDMRAVGPFRAGWHEPEADPDFFRWTAGPRSAVAVTIGQPGPIRVTVTATPAARRERSPSIALAVNDCTLPAQAMPPGQGDYLWDVGTECWLPGVNQLWVIQGPLVSPSESGFADTRQMGARVGAIRLMRLPRTQNAK